MSQLGFYYNVDRCSGCKTCQIACKDIHDSPVGVLDRRVSECEAGTFPNPRAFFVSIACNHCADPLCVENCPSGAMHKRSEDGRVLNDPERCLGCRMCVWSCPYGAPSYSEESHRIEKCDLCKDLVERGEQPACVASCLMRAIEFGDVDELRAKYGSNADILGLPDSRKTKPSIVIKPHRTLDSARTAE